MRLKSLKLAGFKSFANPTTLSFRHGITAIVGPNGCGKSNVIDAIRWVLGETSAKQLRGGAMSDVIFAGTQDKAAKSVASVELVFEHTQDETAGIRHELNLYHELAIRRQINLDGRSDYFINGTRARRRDVIDVFLGTGLGARSYAVIEQGMIGRIVDSNPLQLREFIEEAAGVSRYQARREETQKQLAAAQDNLARLSDLQQELSRQQKTLGKQAESAQRYQAIGEQIQAVKEKLATQEWYHAKHSQQQSKIALDTITKQSNQSRVTIEALASKLAALDEKIAQAQWLKDRAQDQYHQDKLHHQEADQQWRSAQETNQRLTHQNTKALAAAEQAARDMEALKQSYEQSSNQLAKLQPQFEALKVNREGEQAKLTPLQKELDAFQLELNQSLADQQQVLQDQALNQQSQSQLQQDKQKWELQQHAWQAAWEEMTANHSSKPSLISQIEALSQQLDRHHEQQLAIDDQQSSLQGDHRAIVQALKADELQLKALENKSAKLLGEFETLHRLLASKADVVSLHPSVHPSAHPSSQPSSNPATDLSLTQSFLSKTLLSSKPFREQIQLTTLGAKHSETLDYWLALFLDSQVLPALIDSNSHHKTTLAQSLTPYLNDILFYQEHHSQQVKDNPKTPNHSLWLSEGDDQANQDNQTANNPQVAELLIAIPELIAAPNLRLWQQCYLCLQPMSDLDHQKLAEMLAKLPISALILTQDGWLIGRFGTVQLNRFSSGKLDEANSQFLTQRLLQLARRDELEEALQALDRQIETLQTAIKSRQREEGNLAISIQELNAQSRLLQQNDQRIRKQKSQLELQLSQQSLQLERLQADKSRLDIDAQSQQLQSKKLQAEKEDITAKLAEINNKVSLATAEIDDQQAIIDAIITEQKAADSDYQALRLVIQKYEIELNHQKSKLDQQQSAIITAKQYQQQLSQKLINSEQHLPTLKSKLQKLTLSLDDQAKTLAAYQLELAHLKEDQSQIKTEIEPLQRQQLLDQAEQSRAASQLAVSEERLLDASRKVEALNLAVSVASLTSDFIAHPRSPKPDKIAALNQQEASLNEQLAKIGAVNLAAAKELADINNRLEPLTDQIDDINSSIEMLNAAMTSIEATTKTLFLQTLDAVNQDLSKLFAKVFGGGQASLTLNTDELPADAPKREAWRSGLTLMAQPKGKRNSRLAVLSGGEKTLTALSLIFAIFKQHPAPFCVLDEVDAPLDDANVTRFTNLIEELAGDVQFIFISHNKLAMQIANELKGITMPAAGVSTQVSVTLSEAERYLEQSLP